MKIRALAVLPVVAAAGIGLSACDSKVGTAAVVNGDKISERSLNGYVTPNAAPIQGSDGSSTPARQFVLAALVRNAVFQRLLSVTGPVPSAADLTAAKAKVLQGGSEAQLSHSITTSGLDASFTGEYLRQLEYLTILQTRVTTDAQLTEAQKKAAVAVSISPRYGSWDPSKLTVAALNKKQLSPLVTIDGSSLPGDASPSPSPSQ
ncbi:MAG: hypothetical protein QOK10_2926 [Pseudonocardiales bacterium]|nr:hypothetical protein [Pseudonocardiales bacterium]